MSDKIIQFDDAMFESKLDALVRIKVEQTINAMLDAEADEITNAARYERKTDRKAFRAGHYERTLTAKAGKLSLKVPKLKGRPVRVGGDRTLPEARIQRRGGAEGDVPRGREHTQGGRHQPAAVGRADVIPDIERQTQEDLQGDRRVAETPVGIRVPVRVRGRRVAQAILGRARGERERPRRHRRQHGGPARGHRGRRGHARGRGQLGAVLPKHDRTRVEGRQTGGRRPVRRTRLHGQLDAAEREIPAVHGALHAQRALQDAAQSQGMGVRRPEGHLRAGKPRIRHGQGRDGRGRNGGTQAQGGRELPPRGRRRDHHLPPAGVPREPWDQAAHEQHDRAIEQGDPPAHPGRGRLPRLQQRAHARMRQNPLRHLTLVVGPAIHGHVPAR